MEYRDVLLYAILHIRLNGGVRYDEVQKIEIGHLSVSPRETESGSVILSILKRI